MDLKQLRYIVEVYKEESFSKAADKLHVSQPALSKMVYQLEEELDIRLFDRSTRYLKITGEGEKILLHAQKVLRGAEDLREAANEIKLRKQGRFTFGLPPVIGSSFFPSLIASFRRTYPEAQIQIVEEGAKIMEQSLLEGTIDVGVAILPVDEEQFEVRPIVKRDLLLVVSKDHPLAGRNTAKMKELEQERFLMFRKGFSLYDRVREAAIQAGFEPAVEHESTQWDFLVELAMAGLGVAFLPETVVKKANLEHVAVLSVTDPAVHWNLALIRRRNGYQSHAAAAWVDFVEEAFRSDS
ncbi:LysR family transcriptional regulator [Salibacterium halotolerans]|uniref:DNA-binding transcriptional regulator, LysR family n=1 Tax=Salibacterium halotolerans TaxID=1884432 RepID=A0A1I5LB71_9BACI|nr:LysR family transcriptional regulator [Salibacterium halotolerans]SFO94507.1 DNA-binding transcriptional regulator, LysR family [Salibacterium halotolerans]